MPILNKTADAYKLWHGFLQQFPRLSRYTIGTKIDTLFTEFIELLLLTGYSDRGKKAELIQRASMKLNTIKLFLKIAWELKTLDNKKFTSISMPLVEVGKMLGGWIKQVNMETPPIRFGGE